MVYYYVQVKICKINGNALGLNFLTHHPFGAISIMSYISGT